MQDIVLIFMELAAILIVLDIFEFTKALASTLQGDITPRNTGGLTLNPFKHFEPIGFMLLFFAGLGWGKPVQTSQVSYKDKRRGNLITYASPIVVCLLLSLCFKLTMGFIIMFFNGMQWADWLNLFLATMRKYCLNVAVINLIPVYPLSGSRIIRCFLSPNAQISFSRNEKMYQMILIFLLLVGLVSPVISVVVSALSNIF